MQRVKQKNGHGDTICFKAIGYPLICLFALVCIIPFFLIIASSFTSESYIIKNGYVLWPKEFSTSAYELIFKNPAKILRAYGVTAFVTIIGDCPQRICECHDGICPAEKGFQVEKYFFFLLFLYHTFLWRPGSLVYSLCENSSSEEYHMGFDYTYHCISMEYHSGKRIYGRNSR